MEGSPPKTATSKEQSPPQPQPLGSAPPLIASLSILVHGMTPIHDVISCQAPIYLLPGSGSIEGTNASMPYIDFSAGMGGSTWLQPYLLQDAVP